MKKPKRAKPGRRRNPTPDAAAECRRAGPSPEEAQRIAADRARAERWRLAAVLAPATMLAATLALNPLIHQLDRLSHAPAPVATPPAPLAPPMAPPTAPQIARLPDPPAPSPSVEPRRDPPRAQREPEPSAAPPPATDPPAPVVIARPAPPSPPSAPPPALVPPGLIARPAPPPPVAVAPPAPQKPAVEAVSLAIPVPEGAQTPLLPADVAVRPPQAACLPDPGGGLAARLQRAVASLGPDAPLGHKLAAASAAQMNDLVIYTARYRRIRFPGGDLPALFGACTDVIIRAYRAVGVDLQEMVHASRVGRGDHSIDHRRTETLRLFLERAGASLPVSTFPELYQPGDIVTYDRPHSRVSKAHIAIVSNQMTRTGRPLIIHNRGWGPQIEDALFADRITGHYRFDGLWPPPQVPTTATVAPGASATPAVDAAPPRAALASSSPGAAR